jgi:hypothetical protein
MKRIFIFVVFALATAGTVFADENVLIDFSNLVPDIIPGQNGDMTQNRQTVMDYSTTAGTDYTADQKAAMKTSLAIPNWAVDLASSSRNVDNDINSYAKVSASRAFGNVMGVRVRFPVASYNSWASVKPPFDIPAYEFSDVNEETGEITDAPPDNFSVTASRFENGYGVLKNVGAIKSMAVQVYGINAPHSISALLIDGDGRSQTIFLGYLNFDGWATLSWENPQYINEVRSRAIRIYQLYPSFASYVRFGGFIIQRDGSNEGGDFVTYFKDVRLVYDKAQLEDPGRDIDDESEWNIIKEREASRQKNEFANFGKSEIWRFIEGEKKAPEASFTNLLGVTNPQDQNQQQAQQP